MPNRIIRDALLDSPRYWSVSMECKLFFFHLLLLADDFGCISLAPVFIRRRCFDKAPSQSKLDDLIAGLQKADLIRTYIVDGGTYAFIPRYRQRLQRMTLKHPLPPESIWIGDKDAQNKFKKINNEGTFPTVGQPLAISSPTTEVKGSEQNRNELNVGEGEGGGGDAANGKMMDVKKWAAILDIKRGQDESEGSFQFRVGEAVSIFKKSQVQQPPLAPS